MRSKQRLESVLVLAAVAVGLLPLAAAPQRHCPDGDCSQLPPKGEERTNVPPAAAPTGPATLQVIGPGKERCPVGFVCAWTERRFGGQGAAFFESEPSWARTGAASFIDEHAQSFFNNGIPGDKDDVRFFRAEGGAGPSFVLCNQQAIPELPSPPPKGAWDNAVSSHQWGNFC